LEIDYDAFRKLIRYFCRSESFKKIKGSLIANPEASELFYFTREEQDALLTIILEERSPDMPIFAGFYGVRRGELLEAALHVKSLGVDGLFVMPPTGTMEVSTAIDGAGNPEIWTNHVRAIAEATQLPIIVHPAHPRTAEWGSALPLETVKMVLQEVPSVVGWKMIYGHAAAHFRVARYIRSLKRHVGILNAPIYSYHTALVCDLIDGAVNGSYNFIFEGFVEHTIAWKQGNLRRAEEIWNQQMPLLEYVYGNHSRLHIRYKLATWIRGLIPQPFMRPPMPEPRREEAEKIFEIICNSRLSHIDRDQFESTLNSEAVVMSSTIP
jgi:dihydrodipicolinate synthase/N-acetylneuraminate lyase